MATRLTWQNVAAPDFSDALRGYEASGALFGDAATRLSNALSGAAERGREKASTAAMARALQTRDVNKWDQLLAQQGIGGLGLRADQATPEFMQFLQGYREDLATDRADDLSNQRNTVALESDKLGVEGQKLGLTRDRQIIRQGDLDYKIDEFGFGRDKVEAERDDRTDSRSEEDRARGLEADQIAQGLAAQTYSPEEAIREVINADYEPRMEAAIIAAIGGRGADYQASPEFAGTSGGLGPFSDIRTSIERDSREASMKMSAETDLNFYDAASQLDAQYDNPMEAVLDKFGAQVDQDDEDQVSRFSRRSGEVQGVFDELRADARYSSLSDGALALAIENNVKNTGFSFVGDEKLKPDWAGIRADLDAINSPEKREMLESRRMARQQGIEGRAGRQATLERMQAEYELAMSRGDTDRANRILEQATALNTPASPPRDRIPQSLPWVEPEAAPAPGNPLDATPLNFGYIMQQATTQTGPQQPGTPAAAANTDNGLQKIAGLVANSSLNQEDKRTAGMVIQALDSGRDPRTGRPLSEEQREAYDRQLLEILAAADSGAQAPNSFMGPSPWFR